VNDNVENADFYATTWLNAEDKHPEPGTLITYQAFKDGLFRTIRDGRAPSIENYLYSLKDYKYIPGMEVTEEAPRCIECFEWCERGYSCTMVKVGDTYEEKDYLCIECSDLKRKEEYVETNWLTSKLWLMAELKTHGSAKSTDPIYAKVISEMKPIKKYVKKKMSKIYRAGGLLKQYLDLPTRGASCTIDSKTKLLMWSSAGRVMITIQDQETQAYITLIGNDSLEREAEYDNEWTEKEYERMERLGIQGVLGEQNTLLTLLKKVEGLFLMGRLNLEADKGVSIGF